MPQDDDNIHEKDQCINHIKINPLNIPAPRPELVNGFPEYGDMCGRCIQGKYQPAGDLWQFCILDNNLSLCQQHLDISASGGSFPQNRFSCHGTTFNRRFDHRKPLFFCNPAIKKIL